MAGQYIYPQPSPDPHVPLVSIFVHLEVMCFSDLGFQDIHLYYYSNNLASSLPHTASARGYFCQHVDIP